MIDATIQLSGVESNGKIHQGARLQLEQIGTLPRFGKLLNAVIFGSEEMSTRVGMAIASAAPKLWNELPSKIRDCETLEFFKRSLKTHLFTQAHG